MANLFTNMMSNFGDFLAAKIAPYISDALGRGYSVLGNYYKGDHRPQLKVKQGQQDDNVFVNYIGLAVDRSVSRLFRGGVQFNLPDGADKQNEYLGNVWDLNKKEILLYQVGLHGSVYGTPYIKISPAAMIDPITGEEYPRLTAIDPEIIRIKTDPQDMDKVDRYIIEYTYQREANNRTDDVNYREITRRTKEGDLKAARDTWMIEHYEQTGGGAWELIDKYEFPYDFPPIIHWKNLPSLKSCYGDSDIDDVINVQDRANFVTSNTGKIIKYHAHPHTIGTGFSVKDMTQLDGSPNAFHSIPNENAKVYNLEMESDLASSRGFATDLRNTLFDISREVDINSLSDKLGALTNFGLRVLYTDALDKNDTKRQLYGDAIKELNRRLLVMNGWESLESDPGKITWGEAMIVNTKEEMETDKLALEIGIIDHETITKRYQNRYGVDWETIQANLQAEKQKEEDLGGFLLRNFNRGQ